MQNLCAVHQLPRGEVFSETRLSGYGIADKPFSLEMRQTLFEAIMVA